MNGLEKIDRLGGSTIYQIFLRAFTPEGTLAAAENDCRKLRLWA